MRPGASKIAGNAVSDAVANSAIGRPAGTSTTAGENVEIVAGSSAARTVTGVDGVKRPSQRTVVNLACAAPMAFASMKREPRHEAFSWTVSGLR